VHRFGLQGRHRARFTRDRYNRRVFATKGDRETDDLAAQAQRKNQTPFFMIGVNAARTRSTIA